MPTRDHLNSGVASLQPVLYGVAGWSSRHRTEFDGRAVAGHMRGTIEAMSREGASGPLDPQDPWGPTGQNSGEHRREGLGR